jgi:predicted transcriptional regulator
MQRQTHMSKNMKLIELTKRLYASGIKQKEISGLLGISKKTYIGI